MCPDDARMMVTTLQIKALNAQMNQLAGAGGRQTTENQPKVLWFISHQIVKGREMF